MSTTGDNIALKNGKSYRRFFHGFAVVVLVCMLFYMISLSDVKVPISSYQSLESLNISLLLQQKDESVHDITKFPKIKRQEKLVLLWTDYFDFSGNWLPSTEDLKCRVSDCKLTSNRSLLVKSAAVVMHWRNVNVERLPHCVQSDSVQCPIWVLFNKESPHHTNRRILEALEGKVHWTATYRKDSDLYAPYGRITRRLDPKTAIIGFNPNKRLVCWLVSNCNTSNKRENFVKELGKYIEVDIYGKCGSLRCPHRDVKSCYWWLSKRCKFYLSLENSNCRDYTTEKLYHALNVGMVPIVMGNHSNYSHLPQRSYINVIDFPGAKELAGYLTAVGGSRDLYLSHMSWRLKYQSNDYSYRWFCKLCEKLHNTNPYSVNPHTNLVSWWYNDSCWS